MSKICNHWGRDDIMALAAVRYCLGRMTYIVSDCADWLPTVWPHLSENTRYVIQRDVEEEFARDDRAREEGGAHLPLGMDMDRRQWERVRRLWANDPVTTALGTPWPEGAKEEHLVTCSLQEPANIIVTNENE